MSNYIIECKNKNSLVENQQEPFGAFTTTIQDKKVLSEGDQILLKSVFIDTEASSNQKVIIKDPLDCEITFIRYKMNNCMLNNMTPVSKRSNRPAPTNLDPPSLDGRLYLETTQVNDHANTRILANFKLQPVNKSLKEYGDFVFFINYTNHVGTPKSERHYIPKLTVNPVDPAAADFVVSTAADFLTGDPITITAQTPTGLIMATSASTFQRGVFNNTELGPPTGPSPPGAVAAWPDAFSTVSLINTFIATKFTKSFTVPTGNYDPNELCEIINRQCDEVGTANLTEQNITDNTLLQSYTLTIDPGFPGSGDKIIYVCPESSSQFLESTKSFEELDFRFKIDKNDSTSTPPENFTAYFSGTNQLTLGFSEATQRFNYEYMHFPFYKTQNECSGYFRASNNTTGPPSEAIVEINKYGGVLFTNLTAVDSKTGAGSTFWTDIMGFELNRSKTDCILVSYEAELNATTPTIATQVFKPVFNPQPKLGVNMTGGFTGLDSAVSKGDLSQKNAFPFLPVIGGDANPAGYLLSKVNKTSEVEAGGNILSSAQDSGFGYYLIEVSSNFQTSFINENQTKRNVMGIVSKYYVKDSYTSAGEEASVIYEHQGEDMLLSSFDIRILDSDRNLAVNIGNDNTVILQIVKAPKQIKK